MSHLKELQQSLDRSIIALMRDKATVFLSCAAVNLKHTIANTMTARTSEGKLVTVNVATAMTDYKSVTYSPEFFASLTPPHQVFLVAHEVGHVLFKHNLRCGSRDPKLWNKAADYELNLFLVKMGLSMPPGGLIDYLYEGLSAEQIYEELLQQGDSALDAPDHFTITATSDNHKSQQEITEEHAINNLIVKSAVASKSIGGIEGLPAEISEIVDAVTKPKINPLRVLGNYISNSFGFSSFNHAKPHRNSTDSHYLPSRAKKQVKHIMYFMDASGSVGSPEFAAYKKAIHFSHKILKPKKATLYVFDNTIRAKYDITRLSDLNKVPLIGRRGTNIRDVLFTIQEQKPDLALVFTDGYFRIPDHPQMRKTVWYINDRLADFSLPSTLGKTINYTI